MNVIKRYFVILFIVIVSTVIAGCESVVNKNAVLVIKNDSDEQIYNVKLTYTSSKEVVEIGVINPKDKYEHIINNKQEDSITLYYIDPLGVEHKENAVGYIVKGMKGTTVLIIYKNDKSNWGVKKESVKN
ncbi:hypothetical protein [Thermobrachium celere]|uniref:hypothetical protein n=1 Tax=Thermobrachium celere TaxID=53422 RepID=UPI00059528AE|nr:hypothetical protein [Thermobrachium celere]